MAGQKRRRREQTFAEIVDQVRTEVGSGGTWHPPRPNPVFERTYTDDEGVLWTLRRSVGLSYSQAAKLLPLADVMLFDSFPFGETRTVPPKERVAAPESAEEKWEAYLPSALVRLAAGGARAGRERIGRRRIPSPA